MCVAGQASCPVSGCLYMLTTLTLPDMSTPLTLPDFT